MQSTAALAIDHPQRFFRWPNSNLPRKSSICSFDLTFQFSNSAIRERLNYLRSSWIMVTFELQIQEL